MTTQSERSVHRSISVPADVARAFHVFTGEIDAWWPKTHHVGSAPPVGGGIEGWVGGRCFTEHEDGSTSEWGRVVTWEPPHRFVMAWLITHEWKCETDPANCSEVEVRFTPQADGTARVDLEHRNFERMGEAGNNMRMAVGGEGGWNGILALFAAHAAKGANQ